MIDFDPTTARLRLDLAAFDRLVGALAGEHAPDEELQASGLLGPEGPDERLQPALRAMVAPVCWLRLTVADRSSAASHQAWVDGAVTAVLAQTSGEAHELLTMSTGHLPGFLASTTRIGPRRVRSEVPVPASPTTLDDLLDLDADVRRRALDGVRAESPPALVQAIDADALWWWAVECAWPRDEDDLAGSWLQVVDSGAGTWARGDDGLEPSSGSALWRGLLRLLPSDDELPSGLVDDLRRRHAEQVGAGS